MIRFFWVILLHHCIITTCVDPTLGGDLLSGKTPTELGDQNLNHELSTPNHLDMFPEIETSLDGFKVESAGGSRSGTESGELPSATSDEIRDTQTSASDNLEGSQRGNSGTDSDEFKGKVSQPYGRDGVLDPSSFKKYPQGHITRKQDGLRRSRRRPLPYPYAHPSKGPLPASPNGHIYHPSTTLLPQPDGWIPFFSNYHDAATWFSHGLGYGNFHTFPIGTLWEPSRHLPESSLSAHEMHPDIIPQTTYPQVQPYNVHGRSDHATVSSNWAQRSLHAPPFVSVKQDKSQAKGIVTAHEVQVKEEEPPKEVEPTDTKGKPPVDASSSSKEKYAHILNSGATAENFMPQSSQESLHPHDDEHPKITGSDVVDPHKSTGESPRNTGASFAPMTDLNPAVKPSFKDQELEKHATETVPLPVQQSSDPISQKASYKSIAWAGMKSKSESDFKSGTSVGDTSRIESQKSDQILEGDQSSDRRNHAQVKAVQKHISDQIGNSRINILKGAKEQKILRSNPVFPDEGSKIDPLSEPDSLVQNAKKTISSEWIRVQKKKNRGAQKTSMKSNALWDTLPSQGQDTSEELMTQDRQLSTDDKESAASEDNVIEPLKSQATSEVHEAKIPQSNTVEMHGSESAKTFFEDSTPVDLHEGFSGESSPAKDRTDILATYEAQKSARSKRKKKTKKTKAVTSISTAEPEKEIEISARQNDLPTSENSIRGESSVTPLKSIISKVLRYDDVEHIVQIRMTKEDFQRIRLAQDDLVSSGRFPEVFGEKWRESINDLGQDQRNPVEVFRRMSSLRAQYSQKAILMHWGLYKSKLSPRAQEACQLLKVDQEWPTFYNVDSKYLVTSRAKLEALDLREAQDLRELFFDRNRDSRISTLYLMATMQPHEKVFTESEFVSLSENGGSIPVLLQICNLLELSIPEVIWKTFTKKQVLEKLNGMKNIMVGIFQMEKNLEFNVDDFVWVASNTRAFILKSRISATFERRLKYLAKLADKHLPPIPAEQWMPEETHLNWDDQKMGQGEALIAAHFSLDLKNLAVLKRLITHQKKPSPPGVGHVIIWPGKAEDRMKQQITEFYKFHGINLLSN
ncbi:uncharacterized protein MELLADRAFT_102940 [Melampsora larici-populina 98AG31]|uniref:Secreted protein n=1 Tax=Melampsora larici-populina (strain 98AG31 / pathotype 3-4-7) TaxID=747676 RepID=F4R8N4_MELLP|nr:uncharacterized protein MELLADRAFT_102940 [Melampsora larici-populina 98AG31]EGG11052.1 hypothetical protein MELLADRAFT_102940 [Melampsora larici-populina 98AG31]